MCTLKQHYTMVTVMTLALLGVMVLPTRGEVVSGGPKVGQWKTWVLTSSTDIQVPAPPAETSDRLLGRGGGSFWSGPIIAACQD